MRKITFIFLLITSFGYTQNIQFNDPDLLFYLTSRNCVDTDGDGSVDSTADFNNDGEIQLTEAEQVLYFSFTTLAHNIDDIGGFENFTNLLHLEVTTIDITYLDLSIWPTLESVRLSSTDIETYVFNNPNLTEFRLQNTDTSDPLFDLTNLPNLEYVRVQSYHLTDNLVFGTHNNLEELRIIAGEYNSLNLSGMPNLKYLTIADFTGSTLDISNNTILEEFIFRYTDNLTSLTGSDASGVLETLDFQQDNSSSDPSNLDLIFNNQALVDVTIRGANSVSIANNTVNIGEIEAYFIDESFSLTNSNFAYIDSSLDASFQLNSITSDDIIFDNIEGLRFFQLSNLTTNVPLDLSTTISERVTLNNSSLTELNLKNGNDLQYFSNGYDSNIQFICVDSGELSVVENGYNNTDYPAVIHPYCTFVLGGDYYEVTGDILMDLGSGCEASNGPLFDVQFTVTDNTNSDIFYGNTSNTYSYTLPEGNHTLSSLWVNSDFWTVSPSVINLNFPDDGSPVVQDFCISANGVHNDLDVIIAPIEPARPGFDVPYKLIYSNKGNTTLSGSVDFSFDDDYMDFVSAVPNIDVQNQGNLSWNFTDLLPFESREIDFVLNINEPIDPNYPVNSGDILEFNASILPIDTDETPEDNIFTLNQEAVNSFDPNDITCLEGDSILPEKVGEDVHYLVRFENTGTANAINVVVKDNIDLSKYDISSLVPINASHNFSTRITNGNTVEFIFENINLPFDDANNDGYVLFKIKTLNSLVLGDSFSNEAEIYFDYNFPIVTNNETTVVENNLSIEDFDESNFIKLYPNPANSHFRIKTSNTMSIDYIEIMDISGKIITRYTTQDVYDISHLYSGLYFVKIGSNNRETTKKLIKL